MFNENTIVYLGGKYLELKDSNISPLTHTLHYGTGAFEGIRAYKIKNGTGVLKLREHIDRLFYSSEKIGLEILETREEVEEIILNILRKNNLETAYIRPMVYFDETSLGVVPSNNKTILFVAAWEWGKYLPESVSVEISDFRRISEKSTITDAKISGHYVNSLLAANVAKKNGFDEALLLDHNDNIAEGPGENIFFIKDKKLLTPKLGKILSGITRKTVIEIAGKMGYEVIEKDISISELSDFEGAFFTGTAAEVTPISKITEKSGKEYNFNINSGIDIKKEFFEIVGEESSDENNYFTLI